MLIAILSALTAAFFASTTLGLAALAGGAILLALAALSSIRALNLLFEILASFVATQLGVFKAMSGHTFQTWQPAESRKKTR